MIRSESITMIREKALEGKSTYAIGKELGISKNTVQEIYGFPGPVWSASKGYPMRGSKARSGSSRRITGLWNQGIFQTTVGRSYMEPHRKISESRGKDSLWLKDYVRRSVRPKFCSKTI